MQGTRIIITAVLALVISLSAWSEEKQNTTPKAEVTATAAKAPTSAPAETLAEQVLAKTQPAAPAEAPADTPQDLSQLTVRFQFDGVPYMDIVRRFSQAANKPLIGDANIEGKLTFVDDRPYTYREALDTLNTILSMKGFTLREEGRFLRIRPLNEMPATTKIFPGLAETAKINPSEIVTVTPADQTRRYGRDLQGPGADGFVFRFDFSACGGQRNYRYRPH